MSESADLTDRGLELERELGPAREPLALVAGLVVRAAPSPGRDDRMRQLRADAVQADKGDEVDGRVAHGRNGNTAALARITAHLSRYTCAGPIPLTFAASLGSDGGIDIIATARVEDCDRPGVMIDVPCRGGVRVDATEADVDATAWRVASAAFDHELRHALCRDGAPVRPVT